MKTSPQFVDEVPHKPATDYSRWRLQVTDVGRHQWKYLSPEQSAASPQTIEDKFWLGLETVRCSFSAIPLLNLIVTSSTS